MNHPLPGFELEQLRRESRGYLMHNSSDERYALFLNAFFATEYANRSVLMAVAMLLAGDRVGGDGE